MGLDITQDMERLIKSAKEGNQEALTAIYAKTSGKAYYLAMQFLKDEDQAQDILQDSFIKAFQNLDSLKEPEKFQGWLNTIVVNKSKDYLKRKKTVLFSQMVQGDDEDATVDFEDESGQFSPEKTVDYSETKRLIQNMIDGLPKEQRLAIILRYLEDMPVKQIAQIMECSEGTVKSRLNYGRKTIKEKVLMLEKQGTKLYCAPLIPFLFWMFQQEYAQFAIPLALAEDTVVSSSGAVADNMVSGAGSGDPAAGSTSAALGRNVGTLASKGVQAAGKAGLSQPGKAAVGKLVAAVLVACVGTGAAASIIAKNRNAETNLNLEADVTMAEFLDIKEDYVLAVPGTEGEALEAEKYGDGWHWVDDVCYYYMDGEYLIDTTTPDGHTVDATGAWAVYEIVQSQSQEVNVSIPQEELWKLTALASTVYGSSKSIWQNNREVAYDTDVMVQELDSERKTDVLDWYIYNIGTADPRITEIHRVVDSYNEFFYQISLEDLQLIMQDILGSASSEDIGYFSNRPYNVELMGTVCQVPSTGDYGAAGEVYFSPEHVTVVMIEGVLKLTGEVLQFADSGYEPVKTFEAYFVPNAGSAAYGYQFNRLLVY